MSLSTYSKLKKFKEDGFLIIPSALSSKSIDLIHKDITFLAKLYLKKLKLKWNNKISTPEVLSQIEEKNNFSFYELCGSIGDLTSMSALQFKDRASEIYNAIINSYNAPLSASHSALFLNKKKVKRLQYKWHQESSAFPQHKIGCHLWYPLFNDVKTTGGPMLVKKKSHTNKYKYNVWSEKNGVTQLEINPKIINKFKTIECNVKVGDIVIFDHKLVHCTKEVMSITIPRITGIRRFVGNKEGKIIPCSTNLNSKHNEKKLKLIKKFSKK
jgi:hypothetical protein